MESYPTFSFQCENKTLETQKFTPAFRGPVMRVMAQIRRECEGMSEEEITASESTQIAVAAALYEHAVPLLWSFLSAQSKQALANKDMLYNIDPEPIGEFWKWATEKLNEISNFSQPRAAATTTPPAPSQQPMPISAERMAGL